MSQVPPPSPPPHPSPPPYPPTPRGHPQAAPGAPGLAGPAADIRPRARWFWIGGGIIVLGIGAAIAMFVLGFVAIADTVDDFERVSPDGGDVRIEAPGDQVVYNEGRASLADVVIMSPDGEPIRLSFYSSGLTYDFNGRSGEAIYTFDATGSGVYRVQTNTDIAIGESIAGDLVRTILLPFVVGGVTFLLGLVVIIVTAIRRSGSKKRTAAGF